MDDVIARLVRELPGTDRDRYEIAYERGRAQARSSLLLGGLAVGALLGAVTMFFVDPVRGKARRHEAGRQVTGRRNEMARVLDGRLDDARNRLRGAAIESGLAAPPPDEGATASGPNEEQEPVRRWTAAGTLGEPEAVSSR